MKDFEPCNEACAYGASCPPCNQACYQSRTCPKRQNNAPETSGLIVALWLVIGVVVVSGLTVMTLK